MALNNNAININAGFEVGSQQPLDSRQWLSTAEMKNVDVNIMPDPYYAINKEDHFLYIFSKTNSISESTGYFTKYTSDGGMTVWKGSEAERDALPEETKADESIIFYTWDTDSAEYKNVVSKTVGTVENISEAEYQALETKDARTIYTTPGHIRVGEETIIEPNMNPTGVILIQDSYGTNNGSGQQISTTTGEQLTTILSKFGIPLHYKARNGAGFANGFFLDNLQQLDSEVTDKASISDIWVLGGWNDEINRNAQTENDVRTGMDNFYTYAKEHYPNARLHLAFISYGLGYNGLSTDSGFNGLYKTLNIYRNSLSNGFLYEGRLETVLHNLDLLMQVDYAHPNANGVTEVAKRLGELILTGDTHIHYRTDVNIAEHIVAFNTVPGIRPNIPSSASLRFIEQINDDLYTLDFAVGNENLVFEFLDNYQYKTGMIGATIRYPLATILLRLHRQTGIHGVCLDIPAEFFYIPEGSTNAVRLLTTARLYTTPLEGSSGSYTGNTLTMALPYLSDENYGTVSGTILSVCLMSGHFSGNAMQFI